MVQCKNCGFLCVREHSSREIVEAEPYYREKVMIPTEQFIRAPICFVRAAELYDETVAVVHDEAMAAIYAERECGSFSPWKQGFTPKEHVEMLQLIELDRRTRDWRDEEMRWRRQAEALAETRHQEMRRDNDRRLVISVLVSVLCSVIAFVAAMLGIWLAG